MVTPESLASQIKTLEVQLAVLKAQLKRLRAPAAPTSVADLYGIFAGKVRSGEEEINAVRYRFTWNGEEIP